jgi:hypothetical protein
MKVFLLLFLGCLLGGFGITFLAWLLFWAVDIFEVPKRWRRG